MLYVQGNCDDLPSLMKSVYFVGAKADARKRWRCASFATREKSAIRIIMLEYLKDERNLSMSNMREECLASYPIDKISH